MQTFLIHINMHNICITRHCRCLFVSAHIRSWPLVTKPVCAPIISQLEQQNKQTNTSGTSSYTMLLLCSMLWPGWVFDPGNVRPYVLLEVPGRARVGRQLKELLLASWGTVAIVLHFQYWNAHSLVLHQIILLICIHMTYIVGHNFCLVYADTCRNRDCDLNGFNTCWHRWYSTFNAGSRFTYVTIHIHRL